MRQQAAGVVHLTKGEKGTIKGVWIIQPEARLFNAMILR